VSQIRLARIAAWCVVVSSLVAPHRLAAQARASSRTAPFTVVETSIADLRRALEQKRTTSHEIVQQYLLRIATYEDRLNGIITVNPRALAIADSMDRERARGRIRGPLHGIPIALKDNINTTAMRTTGGALAFRDLVPPYDATLAKNLEDAGAIKYGQALLDISDEMNVGTDRERYEADRRKDVRLSATNGLDAALKANRLDALFFPGVSSAGIGARPGYPTVTVPWAFVPVPPGEGANAFPAGFDPKPQPFNVSFTGTACSEPKLIALAYAFEQATKRRIPPPQFP
jgi:Asp-tRNA(Asn)/Glu-tRNA(Gln) amidotransferase A subunit family amidase